MLAFDEESLTSKVVLKNLGTDQHYLEAMVEGCRVARHGGSRHEMRDCFTMSFALLSALCYLYSLR